MNTRASRALWIACAVTVAAGGTVSALNTQALPTGASKPTLDVIKKLAGTWVELGEDGQPTDKVANVWRVTSGGFTVVETVMPGTKDEMLTVYHMDGDDLVLTHYCMLQNQVRMKARFEKDKLIFEYDGGTFVTSHDEAHMHRAEFTFVDEDHIKTRWEMFEKGENTYTASGDLVRRETASDTGSDVKPDIHEEK